MKTNLMDYCCIFVKNKPVMKSLFKILYFNLTAILVFLSGSTIYAQNAAENQLKFEKTTHNFGKFSVKAGPKQCSFEFTNAGSTPIVINNVISSCGCTEPVWPKQPIMPGKGGKIDVTYLNDQGPFPFEKTITVYTSASKKPILLRISGVVYENEKSVKELFPIAIGPLGIMRNNIKIGQMPQGYEKSGSISIANLSAKSVEVSFADISKGLYVSVNPKTIKPGEIAELFYSINTAEHEYWGNTVYSASLVCNGVKASTPIKFNAMIIDNFMGLTNEQKNKGPMILAKNSSVSLGNIAKGAPAEAVFHLRNTGVGELKIHKADTNDKTFTVSAPQSVKPGQEFTVKANIDSNKYTGEQVFTITLVTNSPNRPLVNLFVATHIK